MNNPDALRPRAWGRIVTATTDDWRRLARRRLPKFAFDYLDGGAGNERCLEHNREALGSLSLLPDALVDVTECNTKMKLFGREFSYPLVVAPSGLTSLFWHDGDIALARGAKRAGIPSVISTAATSPITEVAAENPEHAWFQLYIFGDRRITEALLQLASNAGCGVLMLTVDTVVSGLRARDVRNRFQLPFRPSLGMMLDVLAHPRWLLSYLRFGAPRLANIAAPEGVDSVAARAKLLSRHMDPAVTWKTLDWIRERWRGPLVLKGILRPSDARLACDAGVDAIVVSNHGGRQLDSAPATIEMLPAVCDAVGRKMPVLIDGGFRSGTDIVKALALGADAVLLGRSLLFALAARGEQGVHLALAALAEDVIRTLRLLGVNDVRKLRADHVRARAR